MDLHWSWESSPSPRGFTIKCFIQLVVLCFNILTLVDFQVQLGVWFLHNNNAATHTRFVFHNHQIHWKLILTCCDCCIFAIVIVIVTILRSEQKSETGVAFAVQWVARPWLPGRCKFPHRFHIGAHTLKKLRIKQNQRLASISHSWRSCPLYEDTQSLR